MDNPTRRPTKAEAEFEGDCFGKLYKKDAAECLICLVAKQCRRVCKLIVKPENEEQDMAKKMKKGKKEKEVKAEKPAKEPKVVALSKQYKADKENFGMREGSAGWAVFKVLAEGIHKRAEFTAEELANKTRVFCKTAKIKFNQDAKLPIMLRIFQAKGLIQKIGKEEYKKVI